MNIAKRTVLTIICSIILIIGCAILKPDKRIELSDNIPSAQREFRAAWVATVANINWPSKPGLTIKTLQEPGKTVQDVVQECQDQVSEFVEKRKKYFLYE